MTKLKEWYEDNKFVVRLAGAIIVVILLLLIVRAIWPSKAAKQSAPVTTQVTQPVAQTAPALADSAYAQDLASAVALPRPSSDGDTVVTVTITKDKSVMYIVPLGCFVRVDRVDGTTWYKMYYQNGAGKTWSNVDIRPGNPYQGLGQEQIADLKLQLMLGDKAEIRIKIWNCTSS